MVAQDLISDLIPALLSTDTGQKALNWMEIFRISHMPILENNEFVGLISDTDIYDINNAEESINKQNLSISNEFVFGHQHIFDVIELAANKKLTVVPVLDENKKYLGLITVHDLVQYFAKLTGARHPGGIIVLEMLSIDYSLSEIAQIIESNDAKIISLHVNNSSDSAKIEVTLKINRIDLTSIIQTFHRYDYTVKATYIEEEKLEELYDNRFEAFINYLNI